MIKNYIRTNSILPAILAIFVPCMLSCESYAQDSKREVSVSNTVNTSNPTRDSLYHLYDSLSIVMWGARDNLLRLESKSDVEIDDEYSVEHQMYLQDVYQNVKKLDSLDAICDSLNIPAVNYRVFKDVNSAISFLDSCILIRQNSTQEQVDTLVLNQIIKDRERLVKMQERIH